MHTSHSFLPSRIQVNTVFRPQITLPSGALMVYLMFLTTWVNGLCQVVLSDPQEDKWWELWKLRPEGNLEFCAFTSSRDLWGLECLPSQQFSLWEPPPPQDLFWRDICKIKIIFMVILRHYLPIPFPFSYMCTAEFFRGYMMCDDIV